MNFTLTELLLLVLGAAALVAIVYVVRLLAQLSRTLEEAQRFIAHLNQLGPQLDRILVETEGELAELRKVTQKVDGIAGHVGAITQKAAGMAVPALHGVGELAGPLKYISAAVTGAQLVMQMLRKRKEEKAESSELELQEEKDA